MHEYAFDVKLFAAIRVRASTLAEARKAIAMGIECSTANLGAWPNGDPILAEVSADAPESYELYEVDGEEAVVCPECGAVEGEPEWGTVGDGFDGYCPSCADARDGDACPHCGETAKDGSGVCITCNRQMHDENDNEQEDKNDSPLP